MNKTTLNWAIAAPGRIAAKFAEALKKLSSKDKRISCYAVGSRNKERAEKFASEWGFNKCYDSYEELFADPNVDVVYIANPHTFHVELTLQALNAGKNVVVEKPASVNAILLQKVIDTAQDKNLFFMEAYWTAFNKTVLTSLDWIRSGIIGDIIHTDTRFCINRIYEPEDRLFNPALAGGALLDLGIYPLGFSMMVARAYDDMKKGKTKRTSIDFGSVAEPRKIVSNARISKGIDFWNGISLTFANGMTSTLQSAVDFEPADNAKDSYIYGTKGRIHIHNFWMSENAELYVYDGTENSTKIPAQKIENKFAPNGYENEIIEATDCILKEKKESPLHTSSDALSVCKVMDTLRSQWHLVYPFEKEQLTSEQNDKYSSQKTTNNSSNDTITVYTDGGCSGNPGPGGWGCVIIDGTQEHCYSGGESSSTNNKMELTAAISALFEVKKNPEWNKKKILVFSDSQYVKNGITSWIKSWKKNGWKTSNKKPVMNKELWEELDELYSSLNVEWSWVKGHAGVKYNEICDQLCQREIHAQY